MANWWWVFPASEAAQYSNSAAKPPGTVAYSTQSGSAQDNALHTGGTVTVGGKPYSRWIGPYDSASALNAANTANNSTAAGIAAGISAGTSAAGGLGLPTISNPLSAFSNLFSFLSSRQSWIRVAEIIIGAALVIVAADELAKGTPAANTAHTVAKAAFLK